MAVSKPVRRCDRSGSSFRTGREAPRGATPRLASEPVETGSPDLVGHRTAPKGACEKNEASKDMFAVIKTGGKQYKVATDDVITIERLQGEAGDVITFDEVLLIGGETTVVGAPVISGASVSATLVEQSRAKKVIIFKKRRRKSWRKKEGHRQDQSVVKITAINA